MPPLEVELEPWLSVLRPHLHVRVWRHKIRADAGFPPTMAPRISGVTISFTQSLVHELEDDRPRQVRFRRAIELLGVALRVSPTVVWPQLRPPTGLEYVNFEGESPFPLCRNSSDTLNVSAFRVGDLTPTVEIEFPMQATTNREDYISRWFACCASVFIVRRREPRDEEYESAKRVLSSHLMKKDLGEEHAAPTRLRFVLLHRKPEFMMCGFGVTRLDDVFSPELDAFVKMLERITFGAISVGSVYKTSGHMGGHEAPFRIEHVELQLFHMGDHAASCIARVRRLGITVGRLTAMSSWSECFDQIVASTQAGSDAAPTTRMALWVEGARPNGTPDTLLGVASVLRQVQTIDELSVFFPNMRQCCFDILGVWLARRTAQPSVKNLHIMCHPLNIEYIDDYAFELDLQLKRSREYGIVDSVAPSPEQKAILETQGRWRGESDSCAHPVTRCDTFLLDALELADGRLIQVPKRMVKEVAGEEKNRDRESLPRWNPSIESFTLQAYVCHPDHASQVIRLLGRLLPSTLRVLDLDLSVYARINDTTLGLLLRSFPHLESLRLPQTELDTLDVVLDACREGLCQRLSLLSVDSGGPGFIPFFEALADSESVVSKTLTELRVLYREEDEHDKSYLHAIEEALSHNAVLQFLELVVVAEAGADDQVKQVAQALARFHREALPVRSRHTRRMPLRCKLAFLAVLQQKRAVQQQLDSYTATRVLMFAAPSEHRLIHLYRERSRRDISYAVNSSGDGMTWEEVDQVAVNFR